MHQFHSAPTLHTSANQEPSEKKVSPAEAPSAFDRALVDARTVLISDSIDSKLSHRVNSQLLALERMSEKPITIFINSPGGEIHSGFSIFDTIRFIQPQVYTIVSGLAASMATLIALAAPKERRFAFPYAKFMIHQPSMGGLGGSVSDIEIHAKDLLETKEQIVKLYCDECGRSREEVVSAIDRDKWLKPSEAIDFGLISKIITGRKELPAEG